VRIGTHRITTASGFASLFRTRHYREEEEQVDRTALELLAFLNMSEAAARPAQTLPYGDQRKLEIAVALAARPELLLLDEPAAGMNPDEGRRLVETITSIRDRGVTILLVEHHMKVVLGVCDRIIVLDHGIKIAEGEPYEVARRRDVIEVYLGSGATRE
jgi:branched-chain amino acid transport system ATP-binding protein